MNHTSLTLKFLETHNACKNGIDFVKRNKLIGFPLSMIDQVEGDYDDFVSWFKIRIEGEREYDSNGNVIHFKNSYGAEYWQEYDSNGNVIHFKNSCGYEQSTETEYYSDGQLKRIGGLKIPFFEK